MCRLPLGKGLDMIVAEVLDLEKSGDIDVSTLFRLDPAGRWFI
jgi:hypothetical protein